MVKSSKLPVPAKWTPDCQGKQDFDGNLVTLSTRYWPRGGGFYVLSGAGWQGDEARPEIRPSAHATIYLGSTDNDFYDDAVPLIEVALEGDTEDEVKARIEAWAAEQFSRVRRSLLREFGGAQWPARP